MLNIRESQLVTIRETLLDLDSEEKIERKIANADYLFYDGMCKNTDMAKQDKTLYGQNWENTSNTEYAQTQEIRNKVKPRLKKQARFMFGVPPTITFKAINIKDKIKCEELRQFVDDIFTKNKFWNKTRKAFLEASIKKRVLLRVEANPKQRIRIKYEKIENFAYKEIDDFLVEVKIFEEDKNNVRVSNEKDRVYYVHRYYYDRLDEKTDELTCMYEKLAYSGDDLSTPIKDKSSTVDTGFSTIPCWLIRNGGELNDKFGESEVTDLRNPQTSYNKTVSDYRDALKFEMFGSESVIDGAEEDVNNFMVAPGSLHALKTRSEALEKGKQATIKKEEYSFASSQAANDYLDRAEDDMNELLDMPTIKDMNNIPSAKAMKYLYNDLMGRCEEKWSDWEPVFIEMIIFIVDSAKACYGSLFKEEWNTLIYTMLFDHNYPIPSDEEDKKKTAMDEVIAKVRSKRSYIKDFTDEEDAEEAYKEILEEITHESAIESGELDTNTNKNNGSGTGDVNE